MTAQTLADDPREYDPVDCPDCRGCGDDPFTGRRCEMCDGAGVLPAWEMRSMGWEPWRP